jgi:hypothetical protein
MAMKCDFVITDMSISGQFATEDLDRFANCWATSACWSPTVGEADFERDLTWQHGGKVVWHSIALGKRTRSGLCVQSADRVDCAGDESITYVPVNEQVGRTEALSRTLATGHHARCG